MRATAATLPGIAPGKRTLIAPVVREPVLHRQIADVLRREIAAPGRISDAGVCWWSTDMAAYAGRVPGIRTGRGCIAGVADLTVLYQGRAFFIELKADDGQLSPDQAALAVEVLFAGCRYGVARDARECLALLDAWGIPRRGAMRL